MNLKNNIILKFAYLLFFLVVCFSYISITQEKEEIISDRFTNIAFKHEEYDFGIIPEGKSVSAVFKFSNTGDSPLLIKDVTTSCGCTVPEWPKEIIKPDGNGEIKTIYDAKHPGRFQKTITVHYNGKDSPKQITIKGEVAYAEEEKIPSNEMN